MSYVHMLIIKDDSIHLASVPYRSAMNVLEKGIDRLIPLLKAKYLDTGYIVIDMNKKTIINSQFAFPMKKVACGFDVLDL